MTLHGRGPADDPIRAALDRVWDSQGREMASFEVPGREDDLWIQYVDGQLNLAWPFDRSPDEVLPQRGVRLAGSAFTMSWGAGASAQIGVGDLRVSEVTDLVRQIVRRALSPHGDDDLDCRTLRIG